MPANLMLRTTVLYAALAVCGLARAADAPLQAYLAEHGQDVEACFGAMPAPESGAVRAQPAAVPDVPPPAGGQVVIAIDASGSMAARAGGVTKMEAAKRAASHFLGTLPEGTAVGLLAFGHRGSNRPQDQAASCAASESIYAVGRFDAAAVDAALAQFDATGWTPLASAIEAAGKMLPPSGNGAPQAVYVVSDGEDTCGGDPVAAARALHAGGTRAIVNVIGFDLPAADRAQLKAVADAGGGVFAEVDLARADAMSEALRASNRNFIAALTAKNINFTTQLRNDNRRFAAGTKLSNCVFSRTLRESNALHAWLRDRDVADADRAPLRRQLDARHQQFKARAEALIDDAQRATDAANARIDAVQDANDAATRESEKDR